jgi:quercetin dioxygenase-like cupin family protein
MTDIFKLQDTPLHLGLGATVVVQEPHDGSMQWYERYGQRHESDGAEGRLVSMYTFTEPWDTWEMHPNGEELVLCLSGSLTLHQESDGDINTATLSAGEGIINEPGVWHTADPDQPATALFITAGLGTEIRPR